ncbi:MAG: hypothetical protein WC551_07580 [Patescibacteria group bacterium]
MATERYSPDSTQPADDVIEYSSFIGGIDFVATLGQPVRLIQVITAGSGSLVVETRRSAATNGGAVNRTLTGLIAGDRIGPVQINKIIESGTNVTKVRVYL